MNLSLLSGQINKEIKIKLYSKMGKNFLLTKIGNLDFAFNHSSILRSFLNINLLFILISLNLIAQPKTSQISSLPGGFSRMGFAARGMSMGNAMTSITTGSVNSYYNPALNPFISDNLIQFGLSFLSLDRKLNFVQLSKSFTQYKIDSYGNKTDEIYSRAGVSFGLINSGVNNIDGRDNSGIHTKNYSTSENLFFLSVGINPSEKFSIGVTAKYYHYSLFDKVTSTAVGFDVGMIYKIFDNLTFGTFIGDINSKYRWDSTPLYSEEGNNFYDYFPVLRRVGLSYELPKSLGVVALDFEMTNFKTKILKGGTEVNFTENFKVRAGIDRINLENSDMIPKISFGFGLNHKLFDKFFEINYAFMAEPYSPMDQHIVTIGVRL